MRAAIEPKKLEKHLSNPKNPKILSEAANRPGAVTGAHRLPRGGADPIEMQITKAPSPIIEHRCAVPYQLPKSWQLAQAASSALAETPPGPGPVAATAPTESITY
jgi:hypothetical protein